MFSIPSARCVRSAWKISEGDEIERERETESKGIKGFREEVSRFWNVLGCQMIIMFGTRAPLQGFVRRARRTRHPRSRRSPNNGGGFDGTLLATCHDASFGIGGGDGGASGGRSSNSCSGGSSKNSSSNTNNVYCCCCCERELGRWRSFHTIKLWMLVSAVITFLVLHRQISLRVPLAVDSRAGGPDSSRHGGGGRNNQETSRAIPNAERSSLTTLVTKGGGALSDHHNTNKVMFFETQHHMS